MNLLISIDPGKHTGFADFLGPKLRTAGVLNEKDLFSQLPMTPYPFTTLVLIEHPRWYPRDQKDVNDLLDLAVLVGEIKRYYEMSSCKVELVWPRTWKGAAPKEITNARTVRSLSPAEITFLPKSPRAKNYDHNMLDAIGLGLWKLGRLK